MMTIGSCAIDFHIKRDTTADNVPECLRNSMFLRELEIKNFRSLETVELKAIGKLNVLIGKNNSGKSAVFRALQLLSNSIRGGPIDWPSVVTAKDATKSLELRLKFELSREDREDFIATAYVAGIPDTRREAALNSPLARQIEYVFRSPAGVPQMLLFERPDSLQRVMNGRQYSDSSRTKTIAEAIP